LCDVVLERTLLGAVADRQRRAVREGRIIVEPTLAPVLEIFVPPIAFIDFETVGLPVPVWNGCHPYDNVPVKFSCHAQEVDGSVTHHEWLGEGPNDPRPQLAVSLINACVIDERRLSLQTRQRNEPETMMFYLFAF
jgi:hypothetical protein